MNDENDTIFDVYAPPSRIQFHVDPDRPAYASPEWDAYVMKQFLPEELNDGLPKCIGLRRVANLLLGDMIESGPSQVFPSSDPTNPGRATVVYTIVFDRWLGYTNGVRTFSDVADSWSGNTEEPFSNHPPAVASTRAEARVLRKALCIKSLSAEELSNTPTKTVQGLKIENPTTGEIKLDDPISPTQTNFIKIKCEQLNIDLNKLLEEKFPSKKLEELNKGEASEMLQYLTKNTK